MFVLLGLHALVAVAVLASSPIGRRAVLIGVAAPLSTFVWLLIEASSVLDGGERTVTLNWVSELGLSLTLTLDAMGLLMGLLVSGVGVAVLVFTFGYMGDGPDAPRLAALLILFAAAMLGLVWSENLLGLFVFWETTTVLSFLLVGFNDKLGAARAAAWQALLVTGAGGLALLLGIVVLGVEADSWNISDLTADPPTATGWLGLAAAGVLVGAFSKSAQVPAHGWLLGAMAAPTPVSAYLHSATMVAAGVWLAIRLGPVFQAIDWWYPTLLVVGGSSAIWGAWRAISAVDLKRLLAYSTISALGLMFAIIGIGTPKSLFAAVAVLVAHALYKASLFMGAGTVDHQSGTRDLRHLGGLAAELPVTAAAMAMAAISMAAVPATAGFVAKEAAVVAGIDAGSNTGWVGVGVIVVSGVLAVAYAWRLWAGVFLGDRPEGPAVRRPAAALWAPSLILAGAGVWVGVATGPASEWVSAAAAVVDKASGGYELLAWPGWGLPLAISLGVLAMGAVAATRVRATGTPPDQIDGFDPFMSGLFRFANRVAGFVQPGSLPAYVAVIGLVATVPAIAVVVTGGVSWPTSAVAASGPAQAVVVVLVVITTAGVAMIRHRIGAVVALGAVGYAVAGLFWLQGAPDLALTQVLVETVVVAAFVLVFRQLPSRFTARPAPAPARVIRLVVALGVSTAVGVLLLVTAGQPRVGDTPTDAIAAQAEPVGGGINVVNVILTDVRALDTMGEIAVVAAAAIGALALGGLAGTRLGRTRGSVLSPQRPQEPVLTPGRSVVLEALMRGAFPFVITFSLFMLFAGHNAAGGGFIAGLIASAAVALRLLTGDWALPTDRPRWLQPQPLLGLGLLLAAAALVAGGLMGGFGDQGVMQWSLPLLGKVKFTTASVFDVGVYLLVLGAATAILDALAAPASSSEEAEVMR